MAGPEAKIEREVCKQMEQDYGVTSKKILAGDDTGWPDQMFMLPGGKPLLIEFKAPGEEPGPKQKHIHDKLRKLGYDVQVHDNTERAVLAITRALGTALISAEGRKVLVGERVRCALLRPRAGKDVSNTSRNKNPKKEKPNR